MCESLNLREGDAREPWGLYRWYCTLLPSALSAQSTDKVRVIWNCNIHTEPGRRYCASVTYLCRGQGNWYCASVTYLSIQSKEVVLYICHICQGSCFAEIQCIPAYEETEVVPEPIYIFQGFFEEPQEQTKTIQQYQLTAKVMREAVLGPVHMIFHLYIVSRHWDTV